MSMLDDAADKNKNDIKEAQRRKQTEEEKSDDATKPTRPSDVAGAIQDTLTGKSADEG